MTDQPPGARRPNIVICMCDQLRAFEVGCYGNEVVRTPNIDRLAAQGVRFETAVSTYPVCMPARSVLLSGQYNRWCTGGASNVAFPGRPGGISMPEYPFDGRPHLPDPTFAEVLRADGYDTTAIGKWHIHSWPHDVGFDHYVIPRVHHCHTAQTFTEDGGPEFVPDGFSVDFESERVERYLESRADEERPFFLYYNISPPHCPLADAPDEYRTMYRPEDVPIRPNVRLDQPLANQDHWLKIYRWDFRYYELRLPYTDALPDGYSLRHLIAEYYGATTWMDAAVGRLLRALDAAGLAGDTIVLFTSDHGDNLGSHGLVQKGGANEEAIRIPMIVRLPPGDSRVVSGPIASLVDIAPTLLAAAGIDVPQHFHGRDLSAALRGEHFSGDEHTFVETAHGVALRTSGHLYSLPFAGAERRLAERPDRVFDMEVDPYQLDNLAGQHGMSELDAILRSWDAATPWFSRS